MAKINLYIGIVIDYSYVISNKVRYGFNNKLPNTLKTILGNTGAIIDFIKPDFITKNNNIKAEV